MTDVTPLAATLGELGTAGQQLSIQNYTIDHIDASGTLTTDGVTAAFLAISGTGAAATPSPYLASYTPVAGHTVRVLLVNGSPTILGRVAGLPLF